jgi:hypothetical protein
MATLTAQQIRDRNEDFRSKVTPKMIQDRASRYNISYTESEDQLWNDYLEYEFEGEEDAEDVA